MPRLFVKASTQSLKAARGAVTNYPFTMCAWYNPTTSNAAGTVVGCTVSSNITDYIVLAVNATGKPFVEAASSTSSDAIHGTSVTNGQWGHLLATGSSSTSRSIYFNGKSPVTDVTTIQPITLNQTSIGALFGSSAISLADGVIAHAAVWNVVLTQDEITQLANGVSPLRIRTNSLQSYAPVGVASPDIDEMSNTTFTVTNAPAVSTNFPPMSNLSNNYQSVRVPDGMSTGERIR